MNRLLLSCVAIFVVLIGCTTTTEPVNEAQQLTYTELTKTPGFTWFVAEFDGYTPGSNNVDRVRTAMTAAPAKRVCIFVRPTCSCRGTQRMFPQIMKTLVSAGVTTDRIEVWSMKNTTDAQPYASMFTVSQLPAFFVIENGIVRASFGDDFSTSYNENNADSLIANAVSR